MRLNLICPKEFLSKTTVTGVSWNSSEEVYCCGDDNKLHSWNVTELTESTISQFPDNVFPTGMHTQPHLGTSSFGKSAEMVFLLTGSDGRFHLCGRSGRIERSVEAHKGAVLAGQWSYDGSGFLTAGEDGQLKIWSKGGMLRSTIATNSENPIYAACWSPDHSAILHTQGKSLVVKQLAPNTKPLKWKAHDGLVLTVDWSSPHSNGTYIVSGSEDCRYRVWDTTGHIVYSSPMHEFPITAVSIATDGRYFVVGAHDMVRLCDSAGWSHCMERTSTGSVYQFRWSEEGTQLAAACAGGLLVAHIIGATASWRHLEACVIGQRKIRIRDLLNDTDELIELQDRIIGMRFEHAHLLVNTPGKCYIYSTVNWNTPSIMELKDDGKFLMADKFFGVLDRNNVSIYNYQGRMFASQRAGQLHLNHISLSDDTLAIRDLADPCAINMTDLGGRSSDRYSVKHRSPIVQVALSRAGHSSTRQVAILDAEKELWVGWVRHRSKSLAKLMGQAHSVKWCADYNAIAAIQDGRVVTCWCPGAAYAGAQVMRMVNHVYESADLGRAPRITAFEGSGVQLRRQDGSQLLVPVPPYLRTLHDHASAEKWQEALKLCRLIDEPGLWASLAVLAAQARNPSLETVEEAFSRIDQPEKVAYLRRLVGTGAQKAHQLAGLTLLAGTIQDAELMLLQNGLVFAAIHINVQMHCWSRALELALKHKTHIDTVLYLRRKYLQGLRKEESNEAFLGLKDNVNLDEDKIKQKLQLENVFI